MSQEHFISSFTVHPSPSYSSGGNITSTEPKQKTNLQLMTQPKSDEQLMTQQTTQTSAKHIATTFCEEGMTYHCDAAQLDMERNSENAHSYSRIDRGFTESWKNGQVQKKNLSLTSQSHEAEVFQQDSVWNGLLSVSGEASGVSSGREVRRSSNQQYYEEYGSKGMHSSIEQVQQCSDVKSCQYVLNDEGSLDSLSSMSRDNSINTLQNEKMMQGSADSAETGISQCNLQHYKASAQKIIRSQSNHHFISSPFMDGCQISSSDPNALKPAACHSNDVELREKVKGQHPRRNGTEMQGKYCDIVGGNKAESFTSTCSVYDQQNAVSTNSSGKCYDIVGLSNPSVNQTLENVAMSQDLPDQENSSCNQLHQPEKSEEGFSSWKHGEKKNQLFQGSENNFYKGDRIDDLTNQNMMVCLKNGRMVQSHCQEIEKTSHLEQEYNTPEVDGVSSPSMRSEEDLIQNEQLLTSQCTAEKLQQPADIATAPGKNIEKMEKSVSDDSNMIKIYRGHVKLKLKAFNAAQNNMASRKCGKVQVARHESQITADDVDSVDGHVRVKQTLFETFPVEALYEHGAAHGSQIVTKGRKKSNLGAVVSDFNTKPLSEINKKELDESISKEKENIQFVDISSKISSLKTFNQCRYPERKESLHESQRVDEDIPHESETVKVNSERFETDRVCRKIDLHCSQIVKENNIEESSSGLLKSVRGEFENKPLDSIGLNERLEKHPSQVIVLDSQECGKIEDEFEDAEDFKLSEPHPSQTTNYHENHLVGVTHVREKRRQFYDHSHSTHEYAKRELMEDSAVLNSPDLCGIVKSATSVYMEESNESNSNRCFQAKIASSDALVKPLLNKFETATLSELGQTPELHPSQRIDAEIARPLSSSDGISERHELHTSQVIDPSEYTNIHSDVSGKTYAFMVTPLSELGDDNTKDKEEGTPSRCITHCHIKPKAYAYESQLFSNQRYLHASQIVGHDFNLVSASEWEDDENLKDPGKNFIHELTYSSRSQPQGSSSTISDFVYDASSYPVSNVSQPSDVKRKPKNVEDTDLELLLNYTPVVKHELPKMITVLTKGVPDPPSVTDYVDCKQPLKKFSVGSRSSTPCQRNIPSCVTPSSLLNYNEDIRRKIDSPKVPKRYVDSPVTEIPIGVQDFVTDSDFVIPSTELVCDQPNRSHSSSVLNNNEDICKRSDSSKVQKRYLDSPVTEIGVQDFVTDSDFVNPPTEFVCDQLNVQSHSSSIASEKPTRGNSTLHSLSARNAGYFTGCSELALSRKKHDREEEEIKGTHTDFIPADARSCSSSEKCTKVNDFVTTSSQDFIEPTIGFQVSNFKLDVGGDEHVARCSEITTIKQDEFTFSENHNSKSDELVNVSDATTEQNCRESSQVTIGNDFIDKAGKFGNVQTLNCSKETQHVSMMCDSRPEFDHHGDPTTIEISPLPDIDFMQDPPPPPVELAYSDPDPSQENQLHVDEYKFPDPPTPLRESAPPDFVEDIPSFSTGPAPRFEVSEPFEFHIPHQRILSASDELPFISLDQETSSSKHRFKMRSRQTMSSAESSSLLRLQSDDAHRKASSVTVDSYHESDDQYDFVS